ncbi:MAG: ABC transporter permease [Promethearchaeota archaeon]
MSLVKYTIRRILALIPILFGVMTITFIMTRFMPGNPFLYVRGERGGDPAVLAAMEAKYGLDKPVLVQLWLYIKRLFSGNWGNSLVINKGAPVWELIMQAFPRTVEITILSMTFATFAGIKLGIASAVNRNNKKDTIIRLIALTGVAIPVFWLGLILQYTFGFKLQLLPSTSYFNIQYTDLPIITHLRLLDCLLTGNFLYFWDTVKHLIMPVFALSFISIAGITRQTRSSMLEVLELDYVRTARAKGCKEKDVINKHAFRNAMIPTITVVGLNFAGLLGGAVLTETTFNLQAMGQLTLTAIQAVDYDIINASVFIMTIIFVSANLIIDLIYGIVDPRIRY